MGTPSSEMRRTTPATMQDVKDVEDRIVNRLEKAESRQESYEKKCEDDRAALRGEVHDLGTSVARIEEKTDNQTSMIQPIAEMFKGILAHPKVQTGLASLAVALLGFMIYTVQNMKEKAEKEAEMKQTHTMQPIVIYAQPPLNDGGTQ